MLAQKYLRLLKRYWTKIYIRNDILRLKIHVKRSLYKFYFLASQKAVITIQIKRKEEINKVGSLSHSSSKKAPPARLRFNNGLYMNPLNPFRCEIVQITSVSLREHFLPHACSSGHPLYYYYYYYYYFCEDRIPFTAKYYL